MVQRYFVDGVLMDSPPTAPGPVQPEPLLKPAEVATIFRVDPKTVSRWAKDGKISCLRTPGGHRRYRESEVRALLNGTDTKPLLDGLA